MSGGGVLSPGILLGQQAPVNNDHALKPYHELPRGTNAVVLYNGKAVGGTYQGVPTSDGVTFKNQGLRILGDESGNGEKNPRLIDISEPGWIRKVDDLVKTMGKFSDVFILDHGNVGRVAFGAHPKSYPELTGLDKDSTGARVIADVLETKGTLHLGTCLTGQGESGAQYLNDLHKTMSQYNDISIEAITGPMHNRLNQFSGQFIRVPQPKPTPSHEKR